MKKMIFRVFLLFCLLLPATVWADLDSFLGGLNVQAQADLPGFKAKLSAQFGVPLPRIDTIITQVKAPADVFMCLQLAQMSRKSPETVVTTYQVSKGKGWGVIAKELGIKPGSGEFHALKRGDLKFTGEPEREASGAGKGKGKGKGKGHNK